MTAERVLIVDDEPDIVLLVRMWLEGAGYTNLESVNTGGAALEAAVSRPPACILLDLGLPDVGGIEVCRKLRAHPATARVPIVLFTGHKKDKLAGLESGADYFVGKSGDPKELLATFEAVFRRKKQEAGVLERGELTLRSGDRTVLWRGAPAASLTPKAFTLLHILVERGPAPVSRDDLYRLVEGVENPGLSRALDVLLLRLRKSLPPELAARIVVVKNFGYCYLEQAKVTGV
ncbi:MAG: response regulator transcription factor [Elusimicrobiota bacterium]|nr:response regulator transcription factor [Elusimicrobiota bacterium]